jgi:parallel beta-helix repeat protein
MMSALRISCATALALLALSAHGVGAMEVAAGCDEPRASTQGRKFYVDPARGDRSNDGSEQRPWRTLAEVLDPSNHLFSTRSYTRSRDGVMSLVPINPSGAIKAGDTIVLMNGDHGSVSAPAYVNSDFISVVAGKGQTPLVRSMHLIASSHWLFSGIKFQGESKDQKSESLVWLQTHGWAGPSDNIIVIDNSFSTEEDSRGWSPEDWVKKPYGIGFLSTARCTTLVHNHLFNLRDAVSIAADHALIKDNLIEDMGNDGVDIIGSDLVVQGNRIRSSRHTPSELLHPDGIQGWTARGATNRNVVIDANSIINLNPAEDNIQQGISIFDGRWDGVTVTNNLVIGNTWNGISLYGMTNAIIINNTVIPARQKFPTWLLVGPGKDKTPSQHVIVRNNMATQIFANCEDQTVDHNLAEKTIELRDPNGVEVKIVKGGLGSHNTVNPGLFSKFIDFDPKAGKFDLRPGPASPALQAGAAEKAPPTDIEGRPRTPPVDIGAYAR